MSLLKRFFAAPDGNRNAPTPTRDAAGTVDAFKALAAWGAVLLAQGRVREAHPLLVKAVALRDDDGDLLVDLGRACLELGAPKDAERWLRRALENAPNRGDAHWGLAEALQQQDRLDEASGASSGP